MRTKANQVQPANIFRFNPFTSCHLEWVDPEQTPAFRLGSRRVDPFDLAQGNSERRFLPVLKGGTNTVKWINLLLRGDDILLRILLLYEHLLDKSRF